MDINTYKIESYYKGSCTRLWNQLPGETVNDSWDLVQDWNFSIMHKRMPLPATSGVLLHCLARWSETRMVYRFDADLIAELEEMAKQMDDDEVPAQFLRLPFPAISIQPDTSEVTKMLRELNIPLDATFGEELTFTLTETLPGEIHPLKCIIGSITCGLGIGNVVLPIGETVGESIKAAMDFKDNSQHWIAKEMRRIENIPIQAESFKLLIQLLLYINSSNSDQKNAEERNVPKNEKKAIKRQLEKTKTKVIDVGYHIGKLIKTARESEGSSGKGGKKRPHFRRAHWHHYWIGKRDGERTLILKWVMATAIHADQIDEKPTVMMVE